MTTILAKNRSQGVSPRAPTILLAAAAALLLLGFGMPGCGLGEGLGEVTGTVLFQDRPLTSGDVLFVTSDGQKKWSAISPKGEYRIKDVPAGPVKVAVLDRPRVPPGLKKPEEKPAPPEPYVKIPPRYRDPEKSGLSFTVERGSQTFPIKLAP